MALVNQEFENLGQLGAGAAGTVYAARHRATGRQVAIKALYATAAPDPVGRERFVRECHIQVASPHVVQVHQVRVEGERVYLIMELVQGLTLEKRLEAGPLGIADALAIGEQIALALEAAHGGGVIHRDVKPANVFLTQQGIAKLGDFGIAKDLNTAASLTASGHGMGTLAYVSPEQAENAKHVDGRADLYSVGATLYHMLAGRPPFEAETAADLMVELFQEEPPPLEAFRPDCPPDVVDLVHALLEKEPGDREPTSAGQLARALRELRAGL